MPRTITVKGIGKVSAKPDYILISMTLESRDLHYEKAMEKAAGNIERLNSTLRSVGFDKGEVKTTGFIVNTEYEREKDINGVGKSVLNGYIVTQSLCLSFELNMELLSKTLSAVGACLSHPRISVSFTVRDAAAISEEMLSAAAVDARKKAEILCKASGVKLGALISIDYNWGKPDMYSRTRYEVSDECLTAPMLARGIDIEPDNINVSEAAAFVWEIE